MPSSDGGLIVARIWQNLHADCRRLSCDSESLNTTLPSSSGISCATDGQGTLLHRSQMGESDLLALALFPPLSNSLSESARFLNWLIGSGRSG